MGVDTEIFEKQVADIIVDMFPHTKYLINKNSCRRPLTGDPIYLEAFEMVYIFLEIEKRMAISFSEDDLCDYNSHTIERIAERICNLSKATHNN